MNNDYLWDRSGDDADIKQLEERLAVFRYQTAPAPRLTAPEPVAAPAGAPWRALGFAFSAILVVVVGVGIWSMRPVSKQLNEVAINDLSNGEPLAKKSHQIVPQASAQEFPAVPTQRTTAKTVAYGWQRPPGQRAARRRIAKASPEPVELTAEERAAYDQVVLALSITSSKLRLVQDKVNGDHGGAPTAKDNK